MNIVRQDVCDDVQFSRLFRFLQNHQPLANAQLSPAFRAHINDCRVIRCEYRYSLLTAAADSFKPRQILPLVAHASISPVIALGPEPLVQVAPDPCFRRSDGGQLESTGQHSGFAKDLSGSLCDRQSKAPCVVV